MDNYFRDLRYAVRMLIKNPGFTLVAVLALALGIGANTAIFSVVNSLLLRPLPYKAPDRLVTLWQDHRAIGGPEKEWASPNNFYDWRDKNQVFDHVSAVMGWGATLTGLGEPEDLIGAAVSHDMFSLLGIEPAQGRSFRPEEDEPGADRVVVLSNRLWSRRFNSDPEILGKSVTLGGESFTVIGIMPPQFTIPLHPKAELWRTLRPVLGARCGRGCLVIRVLARLNPDATIDRARSEMSALAANLAEEYPQANKGVGMTIVGLQEQIVGQFKLGLLVLLAAVALVLLIACANVANLLLARASAREREFAIRSALGANRRRLIRQLLTESVLLSLAGGSLGLLLAFWMVDALKTLSPQSTPRVGEIAIDLPVLGFTFGVALFTGLAFGLVPALQTSKPNLNQSLKEGRGTGDAPRGSGLRSTLVVSEIAIAMMLLISAGLMMKSFVKLMNVDPGFRPANVVTMGVLLPRTRYPEQPRWVSFYEDLLERIGQLPGVESAGAVSTLPLSGDGSDADFIVEGRPEPAQGEGPVAWYSSVTPEYFKTMGIRLVKGRLFTERDREGSSPAILITETMAKRYFPGEEPLGKRIGRPGDKTEWRDIVGVVADVKHFGLDTDARPTIYLPHAQSPGRFMNLTVRTASDPFRLAAEIRRQVSDLDPNLAISNVLTMDQLVSQSVGDSRFILVLLVSFAGIALLLAALGIYGLISYTVTQRTHEIGLRMALGAQGSDVLRVVVGHGALLALVGVGTGMAGAFALTRLMSSLLFGVTATDPVIFGLIGLLLIGVALAASFIPARRALRVDPMIALRCE